MEVGENPKLGNEGYPKSTQCRWCAKCAGITVPKRGYKLHHDKGTNHEGTRKVQKDLDKLKENALSMNRHYGIN